MKLIRLQILRGCCGRFMILCAIFMREIISHQIVGYLKTKALNGGLESKILLKS